MIARILLPALCAACLAPLAHADKFYLGSPDDAAKMAEGEPAYVEGVLLREDDGFYVIRVEGGEMSLPTAQVYRVEKTALTAADVEQREAADVQRLAAANADRERILGSERAAFENRVREANIALAAAREAQAAVPVEAGFVGEAYDVVLGVVRPYGLAPNDFQTTYMIQSQLGGVMRREIDRAMRRLRR